MNVNIEILTIGDEILYGQILDSNSQWISQQLDDANLKVVRKTTVGDNREDILNAFEAANGRADIVLITGGLGPTNDDLTKPLLAEYFSVPLEINEQVLETIAAMFQKRGFQLNELNRGQAKLPVGCKVIPNPNGTAPGMWMEKKNKVFVSMPGVPYEMKEMMTSQVIPWIKEKYEVPVIHHKIIRTVGIGESWLADIIREWENELPNHIKLAYLPSFGQVRLRLTAMGKQLDNLISDTEAQIEKVKPLISKYIYGFDNDDLPIALGRLLKGQELTISTAESCTGGAVASSITSVPGSSDYFMGSVVAYDNTIKNKVLGVKTETLEQYGAVSEETVKEMAEGVRKMLQTDIAVSTSGIAGPGGGTEDKPVGTVWLGYADKHGTRAKKIVLTKQRDVNTKYSALAALNMARIGILKNMDKQQ
jgi:nicotinamide-nucleotide amidase